MTLRTQYDQTLEILSVSERLGFESPLGAVGTGFRVRTQGKPVQTGKNLSHWLGGVSVSLDPAGPSYSQWCWNRCCVLLNPDPTILGMVDHLGVEPSLVAVGLGAEFMPKVNRSRWEVV